MAGKVLDESGRSGVLINDAGIGASPNIREASGGQWDAILDTNLKSTLFCTQAVGKTMIEQKSGNIINMGSMPGCHRGSSPYVICNVGIASITQGDAHLLGPYNIRVNALAPGSTGTEMTRCV